MPKRKPNRDLYHGEVIEFLHQNNIWTRSEMTSIFHTEVGAADIMCNGNEKGFAIEVKTGFDNSFNFDQWTIKQRDWAKEYQEKTKCLYWICLVFERIPVRVKQLRISRACFLIPFSAMIKLESNFPQASIPYLVTKGMSLEIQNQHLDAHTLINGYELAYNKGWQIPANSIFHKLYIGDKK